MRPSPASADASANDGTPRRGFSQAVVAAAASPEVESSVPVGGRASRAPHPHRCW